MTKLHRPVDGLEECNLKLQNLPSKSSWPGSRSTASMCNAVRTSFMACMRNLIHCGVPEEKMALVLGHAWAAFIEEDSDFPGEKLPQPAGQRSPNRFRNHMPVDALGERDLTVCDSL